MSITASGGFNSAVTVTVSGLPSTVSALPTSFLIYPGTPKTVTLAASTGASGNMMATFTGVSGSLSHSASATVQIQSAVLSSRIRYFPTASLSFNLVPAGPVVIYNAAYKRFFFADSLQNLIFVFDAKTEIQLGTIAVPGPMLLDQSPDGSAIYVGTKVGDIYVVDPNELAVTKRIPAATIGSDGYRAYGAFPLADGRLVLLGRSVGVPAFISGGYESFAIWDRTSNSLTRYITAEGEQDSLAGQRVCGSLTNIGHIALNAARTTVFLGGYSDATICRFDPSSGASVTSANAQAGYQGGTAVLPTPDGVNFLTFGGGNVYIWDASSMTITDQFTFPTYLSADSGVLSEDGNTLYIVPGGFNAGIVTAYNWRTHAFLGWASVPVANMSDLIPMAIDGTGLIGGLAGGIADGGFGFADVSSLNTTSYSPPDLLGSSMGEPYVTIQNVGPTTGGTTVQFNSTPAGQKATAMYFDGQPVANFTTAEEGGSVTATAPPHAPGPVDVAISTSAGAFLTAFKAFSYGPYITQEVGTISTAEGGGTATLVGYGFASNTAQPSLEVDVGGQAVPITSLMEGHNGEDGIPIQIVQFTIPPGQAGTSVPISISNPFGSTTAQTPITYLPAIQKFPLPGASLAEGVYDAKHELYYFTDLTKIEVFSRASLTWQAPIALPNPSGGTQELVGIALSPDGTKLAVSDDSTDSIYVLSTDNLAAVQTFVLPSTGKDAGSVPSGLAISDTGIVYYASYQPNGYGGNAFHELDSNTDVVTPYPGPLTVNQSGQYNSHVLISPDNANVYYLATNGAAALLYKVSTATDEAGYVPGIAGSDTDMALSPDGQDLVAGGVFFDAEASPRAYIGKNQFFSLGLNPIDGEKFSADGKLLFQPQEQSIAVIDAMTALPVQQIELPVKLSPHFDALVSDGTDNILAAITDPGDGIALIDLSGVPEPEDRPGPAGSHFSAAGGKSLPLVRSAPLVTSLPKGLVTPRIASSRRGALR